MTGTGIQQGVRFVKHVIGGEERSLLPDLNEEFFGDSVMGISRNCGTAEGAGIDEYFHK